MKFFADTADVPELRTLAALGLLDGVTTNPSLIAKSGRKHHEAIAEICMVTPGPVSAEVIALAEHQHILMGAAQLARGFKLPSGADGQ